jgi:hypothetical protein
MVAQACNPSYLGGREWKDQRYRPALAKSLLDPILTSDWLWWCEPVILNYPWKHK